MKKVIVVNEIRTLAPSENGNARYSLLQDKSSRCILVCGDGQTLDTLGIKKGVKVVSVERDIVTSDGKEVKGWYFEQVATAEGAKAVKEAVELSLQYDEDYQTQLLKALQLARASAVIRPAAVAARDLEGII